MNIFKKLDIITEFQANPYSDLVDRFIRKVINEGEILGRDDFRLLVKLDENYYEIGILGGHYSELSIAYNYKTHQILYSDLRPSRATKIAFWKWVEKNKPIVDKKEGYKLNLKKILGEPCQK